MVVCEPFASPVLHLVNALEDFVVHPALTPRVYKTLLVFSTRINRTALILSRTSGPPDWVALKTILGHSYNLLLGWSGDDKLLSLCLCFFPQHHDINAFPLMYLPPVPVLHMSLEHYGPSMCASPSVLHGVLWGIASAWTSSDEQVRGVCWWLIGLIALLSPCLLFLAYRPYFCLTHLDS